jgi:DNA-binding response OmpR family regulator
MGNSNPVIATRNGATRHGNDTAFAVPRPAKIYRQASRYGVTRGAARPILIVEDDALLREVLRDYFAAEEGFSVFTADTLESADKAIAGAAGQFNAIMLDVALPDGDGRDYCMKLRREGHAMPIIMLTGAKDETDVVRGLDSGANDYVGKPFVWNELLARLHVHLRLFERSDAAIFFIGPYTFRPGKKVLQEISGNRRIPLTTMETAVLKLLYCAGPKTVDRHRLMTEVWGYNSSATTHTLETHVYRLRQKIEINPANPAILLSEVGGYRLDAGVAAA